MANTNHNLRHVLQQIITWTNAYLLLINWTFENTFQWNSIENKTISLQENGFENIICNMSTIFITLTSQWPRWRLKSPASRLFTQRFIQTQIKENIKAPRHWPLCGEFTGTGEFPAQGASNAENVSIWWRHHVSRSQCVDTLCTSTCQFWR